MKSASRGLGALDQAGVYAQNVRWLTLGDLPAVRQCGELREEESAPPGRQQSAEGIVGTPGAC
jgi:hypothetical protein